MNDTSRYIVAIVLAMIILFSWQIIFPVEERVSPNNIIENSANFRTLHVLPAAKALSYTGKNNQK